MTNPTIKQAVENVDAACPRSRYTLGPQNDPMCAPGIDCDHPIHRLARELAKVSQERMRKRLILQYGFADNRKIDEGKYAVQQMMRALPLEGMEDV